MNTMPPRNKPIIGVTGPDRGGTAAWLFTRLAVWRAGGRAARITPSREAPLPSLDGLIIGGGADVNPTLYGEPLTELIPEHDDDERTLKDWLRYLLSVLFYPLLFLLRKLLSVKSMGPLDKARDERETRLITYALEEGIPILGICRGAQLLNVYFGGTLYQDLAGFYAETPQVYSILPRKRIRVTPGSLLARVLQREDTHVNALHRQAIKKEGEDLTVVAREATGVVQAIEHATLPFILGVQWHPEYLPQRPEQSALFEAMIEAAATAPKDQAVALPA